MAKFDATKALKIAEELEKIFNDRISDFHGVKGTVHYRHNYIHYRDLLWECRIYLKSGGKKPAIGTLTELQIFLQERIDDMQGEKLSIQAVHAYKYYLSFVDQIFEALS